MSAALQFTQSSDGTRIAYQQRGRGPAIVIVCGAFAHRRTSDAVAALLADAFTVYEYDRRGRGDSGNVLPFTAQREIDDLAAVIDAAGGSAALFGHSSGAAIVLEAAAQQLPVTALVAYEPPYHSLAATTVDHLARAVEEGDRAEAVRTFMVDVVGLPEAMVPSVQSGAGWPGMLAVANTLLYEIAACGDGSIPVGRLARITTPTLLVAGERSWQWLREVCDQTAAAIPNAERIDLAGQDHGAAPEVVVPVITEFVRRALRSSADQREGEAVV